MLDAHAITKIDEKSLLPLHEVDLEEVLADVGVTAELEGFVEPCNLLGNRLFLHENGAEVAACCE